MAKGTTSNVTRKTARRVVADKRTDKRTEGTGTGMETTGSVASIPAADGRSPGGLSPLSMDDVAKRAYEIYLAEGQPAGRHLEHWLAAEAELSRQRSN